MRSTTIAHRYAQALFDHAEAAGPEYSAVCRQMLENLTTALVTSPELASLLKNPVFTTVEKKAVVSRLLAWFDTSPVPDASHRIFSNFCSLLADNNRLALIAEIAAAFTTMVYDKEQVARGTLSTATGLSEERKNSILAQLEKRFGCKIELTYKVEPSILGGVKLHLGDRVFDASLRTQLNILKDTIKKGE